MPISLGKVHSEAAPKLCNHLKMNYFQKKWEKGRSRCLQSEGTFSLRSNCIWKTVWNCAFL